jgi:hypothetical protein
MTQQRASMFKPALICGIAAGVLTAVPLVNCFCCLWIIGGAMLAAYLFTKGSAALLTPSDGAVLGILTGIVAALADSVVSLPFENMNREYVQRFMDQFSQLFKEMPSGMERWIESRASGPSPAWFLLGLLASAAIYAVFGALGGLIGVSLFGKKSLPPSPPQGTPGETLQNPSHYQP